MACSFPYECVSSVKKDCLQYQCASAEEITGRFDAVINAFVGLREKWMETHEWEVKLNK